MHPARWLEVAFGSESRVRILRLLLDPPRRSRTEREIATAIGMSPNTVNKAIRTLSEAGLVDVEPIGRAHAIRLSKDALMVSALQSVFESERDTWSAALETIRASLPKDVVCYLYGSSLRGSVQGDSDVDLLIIAKDRERAAAVAYTIEVKLREKLPAKLHVIALGERDARRRAREKGLVKSAISEGELLSLRRPPWVTA